MECIISSPDSVLYNVRLPANASGYDCLVSVCGLMGVVEHDYFGLKYRDRHGILAWINNRMTLKTQFKSSPPYLLHLRVKYFVDPSTLQQLATKHLFFLQTKVLLKSGHLPVNEEEAGKIGALLAQAEMGDIAKNGPWEYSNPGYPQYFKECDEETARIIAQEHSRLEGMSTADAEGKALERAAKLTNWGVSYVKVINKEYNTTVHIGIGGLQITLLDSDLRTVKRISYDLVRAVSLNNELLYVGYVCFDHQGRPVVSKLVVECANIRIARHLYRMVSEDHCFFTQERVSDAMRNRFRRKPQKDFFRKYLGISFERRYYFDVLRTRQEVYAHVWEILHQVNQAQMTSAVMHSNQPSSVHDNELYLTSRSHQLASPAISEDSPCSTEVSSTTTNLTKIVLSKSRFELPNELLEFNCDDNEEKELNCNDTEEEGDKHSDHHGTCKAKPERPRKCDQLLSNNDEFKCRVCMTIPASGEFCSCGNLAACYSCALACKTCAICSL